MPRSQRRSPFPAKVPRPKRATSGRTEAPETPLHVRVSGVHLDESTRDRIHARVGRKLGKFAHHIERASVRLFDVNGPRGGEDAGCRMKVVLSGTPSVVAERTAKTPTAAFDRAVDSAERAVRKAVSRVDAPRPEPEPSAPRRAAKAPRTRATTADRNRKRRTNRMTSALEGSATGRPSRKSTRGSVERAKRDDQKRVRAVRRARSPKRRATKAAASSRAGSASVRASS